MDRYTDLDRLIEAIWAYFMDAANHEAHSARTPTFATEGPTMRTVVVRDVDAGARFVAFHTDLRSAKTDVLRGGSRAALHHWNPDTMQQYRLRGDAELHVDDAFADRIWEAEPATSRDHYRKALAPGTSVDRPRSGHPSTDDVDEPDDPRSHFAAVRLVVDSVDWLHLHPEGHYRAQFARSGGDWDGQWVVP